MYKNYVFLEVAGQVERLGTKTALETPRFATLVLGVSSKSLEVLVAATTLLARVLGTHLAVGTCQMIPKCQGHHGGNTYTMVLYQINPPCNPPNT